MKTIRTILSLCLAALSLTAAAQQAREDIKADIQKAGSNYFAYPGPQKALTAAPKGYEPYYISHYGRHGSRWLINANDYSRPVKTLERADSLGKLTQTGRDVLAKITLLRDAAQDRWGELTPLGALQHRQIAGRMYDRFPEVFKGETDIDAKSTIVIRCILSMENALQELVGRNPKLRITHDASVHEMFYMNDEKSPYHQLRKTAEASEALRVFNNAHTNYTHLAQVLFTDADYVKAIDLNQLGNDLVKQAANVQSTELRHNLSLWEIFTEEEIYNYWQRTNAYWYMYYGPSAETRQAGLKIQRNLLRNIVETADTCVVKNHPGATLRFAHESCVMPLVGLLNLNGYGNTIDNLEQLDDRAWNNYQIYPMGCNVQFVFYKPVKATPNGADILVKVLLNEDEATLPIETDRAPYYHWKDLRAYLMSRLED